VTLAVQHDGRVVGTLDRTTDDTLRWHYDPTWRDDPAAFPLSPRLPLGDAEHTADELAAFFANLLPEGDTLRALLRERRLRERDLYGQLAACGEDLGGALSIGGAAAPAAPHWQPISRAELTERLTSPGPPLLLRDRRLRLSLAGVQDKLALRLDADGVFSLPLGGAASTHILKAPLAPRDEFRHAVEAEALAMRLAVACGLPTAAVELRRFGINALLIRRYDRIESSGTIRRLHQIDGCQLTGRMPDRKYEKDGGPGWAELLAAVDRWAAVPAKARLHLLDGLIFHFLVGNADAHAKNHAWLVGSGGRLQPAPLYDVLPTGFWPQLDDRLAMAIGGEDRPAWIRSDHWRRFAEQAAINLTLLRRRALALAGRAVAALPGTAAGLAMADDAAPVRHLSAVLSKRAQLLDTRLGA
jgi:serine/threonine-protein kinase HipA